MLFKHDINLLPLPVKFGGCELCRDDTQSKTPCVKLCRNIISGCLKGHLELVEVKHKKRSCSSIQGQYLVVAYYKSNLYRIPAFSTLIQSDNVIMCYVNLHFYTSVSFSVILFYTVDCIKILKEY